MYTRQIVTPTVIRWRCVKRAYHCKGTMITQFDMSAPRAANDHNHSPDFAAIECAKCIDKMKRKAADTEDKPNQIYSSSLRELPSEAKRLLPCEEVIKRTLRNQKAKIYPPIPERLEDLQLTGEWITTDGIEPKPFMFFDNGPNACNRIIAFGSEESLRLLSSADTWFMDGNFSMCPRGFSQLYVIRAPIGTTAVSTVFACMQNMSRVAYETLLQAVIDRCHQIGMNPEPATIVVDFEQAVIQAIKNVFGSETRTQGCFYHLTQSTWRKIQNLGLAQQYKDNDDFREFCGQIDSLAFLPVGDVPAGMQLLKTRCPQQAAPLLKYFDETYVSGTFVQRRQRNAQSDAAAENLRHVPPRFPPEIWNVHVATINDCPRTNNFCEGWNNKFCHLVGHQHPSIWKLIKMLQKEESAVSAVILRDLIGEPPVKKVKKIYVRLQQRLKNLCIDYNEGRKNMDEVLRGLGHNIRY